MVGFPWWFGLALVGFFLVGTTGWAQAAGDTTYTVHGRVLNGANGMPLARALVVSADRRLATMTDSQGRFGLSVVVPAQAMSLRGANRANPGTAASSVGNLVLLAQKPGFIADGLFTSVPITDQLNSTEVDLKLQPGAVVEGRVSAEGTDSATNVRVQLLLHQVVEGRRVWQAVGNSPTDSQGNFRFSALRPGEYTAMTLEWRGEQPLLGEVAEVTQQYPPVFYGDSPDLPAATKLHVRFGDEVRMEIHLHRTNFYRVVVPVAVDTSRGGVNVRLAGAQSFSGYSMSYDPGKGAVEGALPNGSYALALSSFGPQQGFSFVTLHVAGAPVRSAPAAFSSAGSVAVHVQAELTPSSATSASSGSSAGSLQGQPSSVNLRLQPEDFGPGSANGSGRLGATGDFVLENVQPGSYFASAQLFPGYVASMTCGGVDLLQHVLEVGVSGVRDPIEITVRDDTGELTGKVIGTDLPAERIQVVLLPLEPSGRLIVSNMGPDGTYVANNVPPGSYRLLAGTGQFFQIAYKEEQTLRLLANKGQVISVQPGGKQTVDAAWVGDLQGLAP